MKRKEFIDRMREVLLRRREKLLSALDRDLGELTSIEAHLVGDSGDAALDAARDSIYSQLASAGSRELREINDALDRMRRGDYGKCENCGGDIPTARLQALPFAAMCVKCQREAELERAAAQSMGEYPSDDMIQDAEEPRKSFGTMEYEEA